MQGYKIKGDASRIQIQILKPPRPPFSVVVSATQKRQEHSPRAFAAVLAANAIDG